MGNVLVTTSILPAIKRKYPSSHISWITLKNAAPLLLNNPSVDAIYPWEPESWLMLQHMTFDAAFNVDKSRRSGAFIASVAAEEKLGFGLHPERLHRPAQQRSRRELCSRPRRPPQVSCEQKTVQQIQCEEFRLDYRRDPIRAGIDREEKAFCAAYRKKVGIRDGETVVGFNTGCSELYPNKKLTIDQHVRLIRMLSGVPNVKLVLVGGSGRYRAQRRNRADRRRRRDKHPDDRGIEARPLLREYLRRRSSRGTRSGCTRRSG